MPATAEPLDIVMLGLSITSSWGNGHATTYRGLVRELEARGHRVLFLERDQPWYADNRDMAHPPFGRTVLYGGLEELRNEHADAVRDADFVIVGSYVPDGIAVGEWVTRTARGATAFYDIDTPVTLATLAAGACEYLTPELVARYDMYLSFTGGPTLDRIEQELGSRMARPLYCSVDERLYHVEPRPVRWHLGYMGTYSDDRQPALERLLLSVAREWKEASFIAVGPQYPESITWPPNIKRVTHLAPRHHRAFYNEQRFTLNITRAAMIAAGWSPSVRLFEAAACGTPIITDDWNGIDSFFTRDEEILVASSTTDVLRMLQDVPEAERLAIGARARRRVLSEHTAAHRAAELEQYAYELLGAPRGVIA
jgi:spore maturation protein CgeB